MSADDVISGEITKKETPSDFFEAIGDKVSNFNDVANGESTEDDGRPPVEEIESLCMNCHENVRHTLPLSSSSLDAPRIASN